MHKHTHFIYAKESLSPLLPQVLLALPFVLSLILYVLAVIVSNRQYKKWPQYRTVLWIAGILLAVFSVAGPLAARAHTDFSAHMIGHLFLGMAAPLLLVLAAPVTLFLRTLPVRQARRLTYLLKSRFIQLFSDPIIASLLNVGGLWILYTTNLYTAMHESILLYLFIHVHIFLAGCLFTAAIIYIDPVPHRKSFLYRAAVLIIALASHGILSKYIYAHPPAGVSAAQAKTGGMLMYYGGDAIDLLLIFILCLHWYKSTRPWETFKKKVPETAKLAVRR